MENLEKIEKQTCDIKIIPLPDERIFEMRVEPKSQKIKEWLIRNKNGEIIKFANLDLNKNLLETIKNSCFEKGIVIQEEEIEKIAEEKADAIINDIDENESIEN